MAQEAHSGRSRLVRLSVNSALLVLVNLGWAAQWTAYKLIGPDVGPIAISVWTFLIATLVMLPMYLMERRGRKTTGSPTADNARSILRWENLIAFVVVGILGLTGASVFGAWGAAHTTAANASLLTLTVPIVTALLATAILHERMTAARWASLAIALAGVVVLSIQAPESATSEGLAIDWHNLALLNKNLVVGNLLVLIACTCSSLYNVCSKGLLQRFSPLEVLLYSYLLALAASVALSVWVEPWSLGSVASYSLRTWIGLMIVGGVSFGLAMVLWLFLLTRLDVNQASVSIYLLPFFGVVIAAIFLHEPVTLPMIIGGAITLFGTILVVSTENTE